MVAIIGITETIIDVTILLGQILVAGFEETPFNMVG